MGALERWERWERLKLPWWPMVPRCLSLPLPLYLKKHAHLLHLHLHLHLRLRLRLRLLLLLHRCWPSRRQAPVWLSLLCPLRLLLRPCPLRSKPAR